MIFFKKHLAFFISFFVFYFLSLIPNLVNAQQTQPYSQKDQVGTTMKNLNINDESISGAFVYNYPIEVPTGRNDLQPTLQLTYDHQNNNDYGFFGYGWSISIPYIERIAREGTDKLYSTNYFNSSLTGELIETSVSDIYTSKIENGDFFSYEYTASTNTWVVKDKQGIVYTFGSTVAARQDNPSDGSEIYKWMLVETRDTNDNFIRYEYYKDAGQIYPYKVFYTGQGSTDGIYEVEFLRETRNDNLTSFGTGFNVENNYRIYEIDIKIDNQWTTKYHLNYILGDNGARSLLDSVEKGAYDENTGQETLLPADNLNYINDTKGWTEDTNYTIPFYIISGANDTSIRFGEINGDGFQDAVVSYVFDGGGESRHVYINNGSGTGWTEDTNYTIPFVFIAGVNDIGTRLADINSDGLIDAVQSRALNGGGYDKHVYINNGDGTGWTEDVNYIIPFIFLGGATDMGTRLADVNGDGLTDVIQAIQKNGGTYDKHVYINNGDGTGWTEDVNYTIPFYFMSDINDMGVRLADVNNDNLIDVIRANYAGSGNPFTVQKVYINNGDGTGWTEHDDYIMPFYFSKFLTTDVGTRLADINSDGFIDAIKAYSDGTGGFDKGVYINNGDGTGWTEYTNYTIPFIFLTTNIDQGTRLEDVNGDGLTDVIQVKQNNGGTYDKHVYINGANNEFLEQINTKTGSQINIDYQSSAQATTTSGLLNPELPFVVQTVKQITIDDGLGNESTIDYKYSDGQFYYAGPYDKKFAGFGQIEKIIDDTKTIVYYHQGNESNSTQGEYNDSYYKIGKPYRQEAYDNNTDELLNQSIYKWEESDLGNNSFVYNTLKSTTDFTNTTKSTAIQYQYNTSNGNLLTENNLGEVVVNTGTGEVTNQLSGDEKDTDYDYAQNTAEHILAAPKTKVISDNTDSKQQDLYYNDLPLGQIDKVNLTKEDYIEQDVEVNRNFNNLGLVTEEISPENATTTIAYDANNLYPISSTDSLNNITYTDYNLLNGQVATSTAPNGLVTVNKYDAFGRLTEVWHSNPDSSSILIKKQEINYQDTTLPRYKETKDYFDINSYTTTREYYDGLDRVIQSKSQTATVGEYATVDISYDSQGRVERQSLPYITNSIDYSAPSLSQTAKTYTYDALSRILTETTAVGTTTYDYDGFTTTITDANGNIKDLARDAHGNLVEVKEYNDTEIYTTNYDYTLTNKLKKIIDSTGNIRNFSYDALDNLEWQDMVHKPSVTNPTKIQFTYDKNGNILTETSFKNDAISYTYDDLNRPLTEKLSGVTKISYIYDQNSDIGQLSFADYGSGNSKAYDYDILGRIITATTTIANEIFVMNYEYDLNGNLKEIVYPDSKVVNYGFNTTGQVDEVSLNQGQGANILADNIEYNQNGQMTHVERANGVITDYIYDPVESFRLTNTTSIVATSTLQNITYTYDPVGNITNIIDDSDTDLAKSVDYYYDGLYRLATSTVSYTTHSGDNYTQTFAYDSIGNMTSNSDLGTMNYVNGQPHQLSSYGSRNFQYDAAGNMTRNGGINKFLWDWRNRLSNSNDIASNNNTYYQYDHNNQRFIKWTEDYVFIPPDIEIESMVGGDMMQMDGLVGGEELDGVGHWEWQRISQDKYIEQYFEKDIANNTKAHIYLNNTKLITVNNNDDPYFILSDHLNSSTIIVDNNGDIGELSDYAPFGAEVYSDIIQATGDRYGFSSKELDSENDLQYFGARYMDNEIGRFTAIDPLLLKLNGDKIYDTLYKDQYSKDDNFNNLLLTLKSDKHKLTDKDIKKASYQYYLSDPQQLNSYAYVTNNPVVGVDDSGETEFHFNFTTNVGLGGEAGTTWTIGAATDGSYGISETGHAGGLAGGDASIGIGFGYSNADSWQDVEGNGYYTGIGGKVGIGLEGSTSWSDEGEYEGFDIGAGVGPSTPIYLHGGVEETTVVSEGNIKNDISNTWQSVKDTTKNIFNKINIFKHD